MSVKNASPKYIGLLQLAHSLWMINIFAQIVVANSYTLYRRTHTPCYPYFLNTFKVLNNKSPPPYSPQKLIQSRLRSSRLAWWQHSTFVFGTFLSVQISAGTSAILPDVPSTPTTSLHAKTDRVNRWTMNASFLTLSNSSFTDHLTGDPMQSVTIAASWNKHSNVFRIWRGNKSKNCFRK